MDAFMESIVTLVHYLSKPLSVVGNSSSCINTATLEG